MVDKRRSVGASDLLRLVYGDAAVPGAKVPCVFCPRGTMEISSDDRTGKCSTDKCHSVKAPLPAINLQSDEGAVSGAAHAPGPDPWGWWRIIPVSAQVAQLFGDTLVPGTSVDCLHCDRQFVLDGTGRHGYCKDRRCLRFFEYREYVGPSEGEPSIVDFMFRWGRHCGLAPRDRMLAVALGYRLQGRIPRERFCRPQDLQNDTGSERKDLNNHLVFLKSAHDDFRPHRYRWYRVPSYRKHSARVNMPPLIEEERSILYVSSKSDRSSLGPSKVGYTLYRICDDALRLSADWPRFSY